MCVFKVQLTACELCLTLSANNLSISRSLFLRLSLPFSLSPPPSFDVQAMLNTQFELRQLVPGFTFNAGFVGGYYDIGLEAEVINIHHTCTHTHTRTHTHTHTHIHTYIIFRWPIVCMFIYVCHCAVCRGQVCMHACSVCVCVVLFLYRNLVIRSWYGTRTDCGGLDTPTNINNLIK